MKNLILLLALMLAGWHLKAQQRISQTALQLLQPNSTSLLENDATDFPAQQSSERTSE
jgi:hypothetical protein